MPLPSTLIAILPKPLELSSREQISVDKSSRWHPFVRKLLNLGFKVSSSLLKTYFNSLKSVSERLDLIKLAIPQILADSDIESARSIWFSLSKFFGSSFLDYLESMEPLIKYVGPCLPIILMTVQASQFALHKSNYEAFVRFLWRNRNTNSKIKNIALCHLIYLVDIQEFTELINLSEDSFAYFIHLSAIWDRTSISNRLDIIKKSQFELDQNSIKRMLENATDQEGNVVFGAILLLVDSKLLLPSQSFFLLVSEILRLDSNEWKSFWELISVAWPGLCPPSPILNERWKFSPSSPLRSWFDLDVQLI